MLYAVLGTVAQFEHDVCVNAVSPLFEPPRSAANASAVHRHLRLRRLGKRRRCSIAVRAQIMSPKSC